MEGDAGSEASYESVASEGGFAPASERGRESLPRIISASQCVEVYRQLHWDGGWGCRAHSLAPVEGFPKNIIDPAEGLPRKLMRLDGIFEAWLEELPMPLNPYVMPIQYESLNQAAELGSSQGALDLLKLGNKRATIWYFNKEFLEQICPLLVAGADEAAQAISMWKHALLERNCNIMSTHTVLGQVHCPVNTSNKSKVYQWLKSLFASMQASKWCPNGECRTFLLNHRLIHASMSVGDCVQIGRELYFVGLSGFVPIEEAEALLPPPTEEDLLLEEVEEDSASPPSQSKKGKKGKHKAKAENHNADVADGEHEGGRKEGKSKGKGKGKEGKGKGKEDAAEASKGNKGGKTSKVAKGGGKGKTKNGADIGVGSTSDRRLDRRSLRKQLQAEREKVQPEAA